MAEKTVLFLCKCAGNISNTVDFNVLKEWARNRGGIDTLVTGNLLCSPREKEAFGDVLESHPGARIIVAACSPKLHEKTFTEIAEKRGINLSRVQMANIREQCAWVTEDPKEAAEKAITLINGALKRSVYSEDLVRPVIKAREEVAVIGGGVAGISAALTLSKGGRKVFLVEREISLGGALIKTEEVAPKMECAPCMLAPLLAQVRDDPNIEVLANAEIKEVRGFLGNFSLTLEKKARFVKDNCPGCGECFQVCPVSVPSEFHERLGHRKAVHIMFPGSVPSAAAIVKEECKHFKDEGCDECAKVCPFESIDFNEKDTTLSIDVGAVILATGLKNGSVEAFPNLGHGGQLAVYTTPEFERLLCSNGPSEGQFRLEDGRPVKRAAVIHCAGSLQAGGLSSCSRVCCMNALKVGELLRHQYPKVEVLNIHSDLVLPSPGEQAFYEKQLAGGTVFIKTGDISATKVSPSENSIVVTGNGFDPLDVDVVILSTGLAPSKGSGELAEIFDLETGISGFFSPDHEILHTTGASLDGIYIAGVASGPATSAESITRGRAAAGDILSTLVPGREIILEAMTSVIDEEKCSGCKLCISSCPFKAVFFDGEKGISVVNEVLCRGCGTCTAACPSGASRAKHFTDLQIRAEIGGLLNA